MKDVDKTIENLRKASVPFIFIGILCGCKEMLSTFMFCKYDWLHIWLALGFSVVGIVLMCIASVIEKKEFNK